MDIIQAKQKLHELVMGTKLYYKDVHVSTSKLDSMILDRLDKIKKIMENNGTYVLLPQLGTHRDVIRVQSTDMLHVERTIRDIMALVGDIEQPH